MMPCHMLRRFGGAVSMSDGVDATEHVHGLDSGLLHNSPLQREEPTLQPSCPRSCAHHAGLVGAMVSLTALMPGALGSPTSGGGRG